MSTIIATYNQHIRK